MYEVWDGDRIVYISNKYDNALKYWINVDHERKGYRIQYVALQ